MNVQLDLIVIWNEYTAGFNQDLNVQLDLIVIWNKSAAGFNQINMQLDLFE